MADLLGRGVSFPPRIGPDGRFACSEGSDNVRESIRVILLTEPNERVMLPQFGGGLRRYLFASNTVATHRLIGENIQQALRRWESRIAIEAITVEPDDEDVESALATIRYRLVATAAAGEVQLRVRLT